MASALSAARAVQSARVVVATSGASFLGALAGVVSAWSAEPPKQCHFSNYLHVFPQVRPEFAHLGCDWRAAWL